MDYSKLSDRELDALVAERVMGTLRPGKNPGDVGPALFYGKLPEFPWFADASLEDPLIWEWCSKKAYSTDDNAARLVRNRIAELGLSYPFLECLDRTMHWLKDSMLKHSTFELMQATPRQQAIAALQALDAAKENAKQ